MKWSLCLLGFITLPGLTGEEYRIAHQVNNAYANGDSSEAHALAKALITSTDVNLKIYGLMMTGITHSDPAAGLDLVQQALRKIDDTTPTSSQQKESLHKTRHTALMAEITLILQLGDLVTAKTKLHNYEKDYPGSNPGPVALGYSKIAFLQGDYEKALRLANKAYALYATKDSRRAAQVLIKVGLYQLLTGKVDEGYKTTLTAQSDLVKSGDSDQYYFSLINMLIYHRSRGQEGGALVKSINHRLKQEPDKDLEMLLDFAKNWAP
jgi:tetratricopeptide (TPR) repeat protein